MKALMKCFPFNSKSIEMLQESLNMSVINDIHLLNRSSNRMAGFLNDCIQASNTILGFLEKNISGSIQLLTQNLLLVISLRQLWNMILMVVSALVFSCWSFTFFLCFLSDIRCKIWDKVFKNGSSKICRRQPLKNLNGV